MMCLNFYLSPCSVKAKNLSVIIVEKHFFNGRDEYDSHRWLCVSVGGEQNLVKIDLIGMDERGGSNPRILESCGFC